MECGSTARVEACLSGCGEAGDSATSGAAAGCAVSPAGGWDLVNLHWMCGALTDGAVELHRAQTRIARMLLPDLPTMSEGNMSPSDRPGLGLMPDEERLAACRVG